MCARPHPGQHSLPLVRPCFAPASRRSRLGVYTSSFSSRRASSGITRTSVSSPHIRPLSLFRFSRGTLLDYSSFTVRLPQSDIPQLEAKLKEISERPDNFLILSPRLRAVASPGLSQKRTATRSRMCFAAEAEYAAKLARAHEASFFNTADCLLPCCHLPSSLPLKCPATLLPVSRIRWLRTLSGVACIDGR